MSNLFEGSMVALVTPFKNGKIEEKTYRQLIDWHIEQGTNVIIPCGTTGESATLSHEEHRTLMSIATEQVAGRVPVICGAGSNSTEEGLGLIQHAKKLNADGVLVVTPYYNKPTQTGLYKHYEYLAKKVDIPFVLYNVPSRTGVNLAPETIATLHKDFPNIVAVKEASGSFEQATAIRTLCDITILSGDDGITLPLMSIGAKGTISVLANVIPQANAELVHAALKGDYEKAAKLHLHYSNLTKILFVETNPIPVKTALAMMGKIREEFRLPLCAMVDKNRDKLESVLKDYGLIGNVAGNQSSEGLAVL